MKLQDIKHVITDDLLGLIGLEVKQPHRANWFGIAGTLAVGMLIGASAMLLLAPKATKELRAKCKGHADKDDDEAADQAGA
jgi:hypothetical protein